MQLIEPKWYRSVYYVNQKLPRAEQNYSTMEREALGMVYNINKYRHYLLGRKFSFHVDHSTLVYLVSKASLIGKLASWTLLLQEFDLGAQHADVDHLSQLDSEEARNGGEDNFPNGQLFWIVVIEPVDHYGIELEDKWLIDNSSFLGIGLPLKGLSQDQKKRLAVKS